MIFLLGLLGLIFGSFLSAFTYRLPRGMSVAKGRSICPKCKKQIAWYDNIPLLSYVILGGKCRNCGKHISLRYPLIELTTSLLFLFIYYYFSNCIAVQGTSLHGGSCFYVNILSVWVLPYLLLVGTILLAILIIDLENQIIPDELVFLLFGLTFAIMLFSSVSHFYINVFTGITAGLFLLGLHLLTKGKGMGLGDVKLALFGGLYFGYPLTITWMFLSFIIGALVGLFLIVIGKAKFGKHVAFGPFLVVSFFITLIWGGQLISAFFPML
jgi:prepilin signal peptidase PulO-like enzyme (type II secretory pathway)